MKYICLLATLLLFGCLKNESKSTPSPGTVERRPVFYGPVGHGILASGVADESWGVRISTDSGSSWASLPSISYPNTGANVSASRHARTRTGQRP